ncbi:hypothetical protein HMPREF3289_05665 [Pseudomonas sp. HMSC75E02]|nr:hypothetical protein HMPREF3289_05665 [Pseudomonas sp. HMSC75E02]
MAEAHPPKIEFIDEHIDYSHRIGGRDVIIQALGQQCALTSMLAVDETLLGLPRYDCRRQDSKSTSHVFYTAWARSGRRKFSPQAFS